MTAPGTPRRTVRIGLTGPIGCGKSTVAAWLAERGAVVVDADAIARQVTDEPAVRAAIVAAFGSAVAGPEGGLDRGALAATVFGDPDALARLEALTHPHVRPRDRGGGRGRRGGRSAGRGHRGHQARGGRPGRVVR